jgi:hypothetical protein
MDLILACIAPRADPWIHQPSGRDDDLMSKMIEGKNGLVEHQDSIVGADVIRPVSGMSSIVRTMS